SRLAFQAAVARAPCTSKGVQGQHFSARLPPAGIPLPARQRLATSSVCRVLFRPGWPAFLLCEVSREDLVDIPQLSLELESQLDLPARDTPRDLFIAGYQLVEVQAFRPGMHGMSLD